VKVETVIFSFISGALVIFALGIDLGTSVCVNLITGAFFSWITFFFSP
jgi:hypothetical protein